MGVLFELPPTFNLLVYLFSVCMCVISMLAEVSEQFVVVSPLSTLWALGTEPQQAFPPAEPSHHFMTF